MATTKIEGFAALERELERLTKAAGKGVLRRSLKKSAEPIAVLASSLAPDDPRTTSEDLHREISVSSKLSKKDAGEHRKMFRDDKAAVEMFVGPSTKAYPQALMQEFGTVNHSPQPYMRPAWDQEAQPTLDRLGRILWDELEKSVARADRKAAKG
jgi:HK97 gp10 family phage protein